MQAQQLSLIYIKKRSSGCLQQNLCNKGNQKLFGYYLTTGDDYPNDSSQVLPYQRIIVFQKCKSGFDHKLFLYSSTSPPKLNKYIFYTGRTKVTIFFLFLNKLVIYFPKFRFAFTSMTVFPTPC